MSCLKLDGQGTTTILDYIIEFIQFCFSSGVYFEEILARLSSLTLDGHAKQWCYSLPTTYSSYFKHLVNGLCHVFYKYEYQDNLNEIDQLRMESNESLEHFTNRFLHLCYEFPDEDVDWQFLDEKLCFLVRMSRKYFESNSSCSLFQKELQHLEEEYDIPFISCPPPFDVPCFEPELINKLEGQFVYEELIFLSHLSLDDDWSYQSIIFESWYFSCRLSTHSSSWILGQPWAWWFPFSELYGDDYSSLMDESLFTQEGLDLQKSQIELMRLLKILFQVYLLLIKKMACLSLRIFVLILKIYIINLDPLMNLMIWIMMLV